MLERLVSRGRSAIGAKASRIWPSIFKDSVGGQQTHAPFFTDYESYLLSYERIDWMYSSASVRAYNIAKQPWKIYKRGTQEEVGPNDPFRVLMEQPNEFQSTFDFLEELALYLPLTGNNYIALEEINAKGQPKFMYNLRPSRVGIVPSQTERIKGYLYFPGAQEKPIPYLPGEILHIRYPNPNNDLYGLGVAQAAEATLNTELFHRLDVQSFFKNNMRLSGYITSPDSVDDTSWERAKADFAATQGGGTNRYKTAFFDSGLKYVPIQTSPLDPGGTKIGDDNRDRILGMMGTPKGKLGIRDTSEVKGDHEDKFFWNETLLPDIERIEQTLNTWAVRIGWVHAEIRFDRQSFDDRKAVIQEAIELYEAGLYTLNESRVAVGSLPLTGSDGDVRLVKVNIIEEPAKVAVPQQTRTASGRKALAIDVEHKEARELAVSALDGAKAAAKKSLQARRRIATRRVMLNLRKSSVRTFKPTFVKFFQDQEKRVIAAAGKAKTPADIDLASIFADGEDEELQKVARPMHQFAVDHSVEITGKLLGMKKGGGIDSTKAEAMPADFVFPNMEKFLATAGKLITTVNKTTLKNLKPMLQEGIRRGYSTRQIMVGNPSEGYGGFKEVFNDYHTGKAYRAERIAVNETNVTYNKATLENYKSIGIEEIELMDNLVGWNDDDCTSRDGQIVSQSEAKAALSAEHVLGTLALSPA